MTKFTGFWPPSIPLFRILVQLILAIIQFLQDLIWHLYYDDALEDALHLSDAATEETEESHSGFFKHPVVLTGMEHGAW